MEARNEELELIKKGLLKTKKRVNITSTEREGTFERYLNLFYKRPNIPYPEDDPVDYDDNFIVRLDDSYTPNPNADGFFAINAGKSDMAKIKADLRKKREEYMRRKQQYSDENVEVKQVRSLSITTDTVDVKVEKTARKKHPLSASTTYVERLQAVKDIASSKKHKDFNFTSEKLETIEISSKEYPKNENVSRKINKKIVKKIDQSLYHQHSSNQDMLPVAPDGFLPNSVVVALYKELRREVTEEEQLKKWKPKILTDEQLSEINSFNNKKVRYS